MKKLALLLLAVAPAAIAAPPIASSHASVLYGGRQAQGAAATAPDAFWCPMHGDVRSASAGKCPVCGMDLVPIPPLRIGEYRLELALRTAAAPRGHEHRLRALQLRVLDPDGEPVGDLVAVHERVFHLFVISRGLDYFAHVHPQPLAVAPGVAAATFQIDAEQLPGMPAGPLVAIADVLPYGAAPQMLHRAFVTPGYEGPLFGAPARLTPGPVEATAGNMRVRIDADLEARKDRPIRFSLSDAASGAPVTDLEPLFGAAAHLLIVSPDLTTAIHGHPSEPSSSGPVVSFEPLMPFPGPYKLWVQFQRGGQVITAPFVVAAR